MIQKSIEQNGFSLISCRELPEMKGRLWQMEHDKSGAKLVWLDRPDENMTFAIGFRTIPTDSTGVFHILEHSVLGGSEKYPVKEPFVELLKSSLQTFLNALTFPDKTVYPFSSRNKQDFRNLMGIYLDAVLHPLAVRTPNVFRQEGWRVEMNEEGKPIFQGVVYNEMKGAYSDVRSVLEHTMMAKLLPDTCYRHESGGDPDHITDLTYEQFVSEHAKYYHPSNSRIILDGAVDLPATLEFLNGILSEYDRQNMVFPIPVQEPVDYVESEVPYEIGAGEDPAGKAIISRGRLLCGYDDPETIMAAMILADYLSEGSEAPLKRAILDAGLGADVAVNVHDGMQQAWFGWQVWNTDAEKTAEVRDMVHTTLENLVNNGLEKERLLGCYNSLAFNMMNRDGSGFPRGLTEVICILESWLYDGDPAQNLAYEKVLDSLREKLFTGYFEELLRRTLLDSSKGVLVTMVPNCTLGEKRIAAEQGRIDAYWNGLSETEREAVLNELEQVHSWQNTPNSPEQLATIPVLSLEDVREDPKPLQVETREQEGTPVLVHEPGSELAFLNLHFEASDLTREEMPLLNLLGELLGMMPTADHSGAQLQTLTKQKIGSLNFSAEMFQKGVDRHRTVFSARAVCLPAYRADSAALVEEILTSTRFDDFKLLGDVLQQEKNGAQRSLISSGNRYAMQRVNARQTSVGAAKEYFCGCEYIRWILDMSRREDLTELMAQLEAVAKKLFTRERLTVSVSANAQDMVPGFVNAFPAVGEKPEASAAFALLPACREGILIPAGVGYAAKGANLKRFGGGFSGHTYVLSNLMRFQYLWGAIRVQGGAYGAHFLASEGGDILCASYRDPNPGRSIGCYDGCADFLADFLQETPDLTKYIVGALSDTDPLLTAAQKLRVSENRFFKGVQWETVLRYARELRTTTADDLLAMCDWLRHVAEADNYCIVGGKEQLDACADLLDTVLELN